MTRKSIPDWLPTSYNGQMCGWWLSLDTARSSRSIPSFNFSGPFAIGLGERNALTIPERYVRLARTMDAGFHWENVYRTKAPNEVSWYRPHLDRSLALIESASPGRTASIIDVGGGEATLLDDLLARGYRDLTILDVSQTALGVPRARLGEARERIRWICADVTQAPLAAQSFDVWHDRAVFHFLTAPEQRMAYVQAVARTERPGGHVIVSAFGPEGPTK